MNKEVGPLSQEWVSQAEGAIVTIASSSLRRLESDLQFFIFRLRELPSTLSSPFGRRVGSGLGSPGYPYCGGPFVSDEKTNIQLHSATLSNLRSYLELLGTLILATWNCWL